MFLFIFFQLRNSRFQKNELTVLVRVVYESTVNPEVKSRRISGVLKIYLNTDFLFCSVQNPITYWALRLAEFHITTRTHAHGLISNLPMSAGALSVVMECWPSLKISEDGR
jgi:hypothetical protein